MFLDAEALRLIAKDLIARRPVPADKLAILGSAYVSLDASVASMGKSRRKPAEPTTEDGKLVARAVVALSAAWGRECSIADLGRHLEIDRTVLSRCNGKTPTALSPFDRAHVRVIAEEGERRAALATAAPST